MLRNALSKSRLRLARKRQGFHRLGQLNGPTILAPTAELNHPQTIEIGRYCRIGPDCYLEGEGTIRILDGTILAPRVAILSSSHQYDSPTMLPYSDQDQLKPTTIGHGVWIGFGSIVMPGVQVGDASIIAAGSVVTHDVPVGSIVGGNPAKLIKHRDDQEALRALVEKEAYYLKSVFAGTSQRAGRSYPYVVG